MRKDAFYFPHDSNAKDDVKCIMLIEELGLGGYGAFWVLIELLREQPDYTYPIKLLPAVARRYNGDVDLLNKVIYDYDLFTVEDDTIFYSESLKRRMELYEQKREQARSAGRASGEKRRQKCDDINVCLTDVEQPFNERSTDDEPKRVYNSKVNNNKESNIKRTAKRFTPPSFDEVSEYVATKGYNINPQSFIDFYDSNGWRVGKNPMRNWKAALRNWNNREDSNRASTLQTTQKAQQYDEL